MSIACHTLNSWDRKDEKNKAISKANCPFFPSLLIFIVSQLDMKVQIFLPQQLWQ